MASQELVKLSSNIVPQSISKFKSTTSTTSKKDPLSGFQPMQMYRKMRQKLKPKQQQWKFTYTDNIQKQIDLNRSLLVSKYALVQADKQVYESLFTLSQFTSDSLLAVNSVIYLLGNSIGTMIDGFASGLSNLKNFGDTMKQT